MRNLFSLPGKQLDIELASEIFDVGFNYACGKLADNEIVILDERSLSVKATLGNVIEVLGVSSNYVIYIANDKSLSLFNVDKNEVTAKLIGNVDSCYGKAFDDHDGFCIFSGNSDQDQNLIYKASIDPFLINWSIKAPTNRVHYFLFDRCSNNFYSIDTKGNISSFDFQRGNTLWCTNISAFINTRKKTINVHPCLVDNQIILIYQGVALAISTEDGSLVWKREGATASWGLISTEHKVYQLETSLSDSTRSIITVDAISGELLSSYPLFVKDGSGVCIDLAFQNPLHWAITSNHIFIGWSHGLLTAINPDTGEIEWHADLGGENQDPIVSDIVISNNRLYCRTTSTGIENRVSKSWVFEGVGGFAKRKKGDIHRKNFA